MGRTRPSRASQVWAFLAGATFAYLLDPADGRRRRRMLRDRTARLLRRAESTVAERSLAEDLVERVRKVPGVVDGSDQLEVSGTGDAEERTPVT